MKFTLALILTVVAAIHGSTVSEDPIEYDITASDQNSLIVSPVKYTSEVDADISPEEFDISLSPVPFDFNTGLFVTAPEVARATRNWLLHRAQFVRSAAANTVHIHDHTWRGSASTRISSVRAAQVGSNQGATGRVISGGVGFSFVTVRLQSQRGRGFNVLVEIYGR